jgi:hypothetical protein
VKVKGDLLAESRISPKDMQSVRRWFTFFTVGMIIAVIISFIINEPPDSPAGYIPPIGFILLFELIFIWFLSPLRIPFRIYQNGLSFSTPFKINPWKEKFIHDEEIKLLVLTEAYPISKWIGIFDKKGNRYQSGISLVREGIQVSDNQKDIFELLEKKWSDRIRKITWEEWVRTRGGRYLDNIEIEASLKQLIDDDITNLNINQLQEKLMEIKNIPEYKKYIMYSYIVLFGFTMMMLGLFLLIVNVGSDFTLWNFPVISLILIFLGIFLTFLGLFKSELDPAIKNQLLQLKITMLIKKKDEDLLSDK